MSQNEQVELYKRQLEIHIEHLELSSEIDRADIIDVSAKLDNCRKKIKSIEQRIEMQQKMLSNYTKSLELNSERLIYNKQKLKELSERK